jgi:hypothetical protein
MLFTTLIDMNVCQILVNNANVTPAILVFNKINGRPSLGSSLGSSACYPGKFYRGLKGYREVFVVCIPTPVVPVHRAQGNLFSQSCMLTPRIEVERHTEWNRCIHLWVKRSYGQLTDVAQMGLECPGLMEI